MILSTMSVVVPIQHLDMYDRFLHSQDYFTVPGFPGEWRVVEIIMSAEWFIRVRMRSRESGDMISGSVQ